MKTITTERRIDGSAKMLAFAGMICSMFAAAGIAHGLHDASPENGWGLAIAAGIAAAVAFAIIWHVTIRHVVGIVRISSIVAIFGTMLILSAIALGASAQAIATTFSGRAALSAELSAQVDAYSRSLSEAYADATSWRGVAESANVLAVGFRGQAEMEGAGQGGSKKGQGVNWGNLTKAAESFSNGAAALNNMLDDAKDLQKRGLTQMNNMRVASSHSDQQGFMAAAIELGSIVSDLNAIDPSPIIESTGMVSYSEKGINLSKETSEWWAKAKAALAERKTAEVPVFHPLSIGEATLKQMFGSALHGWILAGAIDIMPLLVMILVFAFSRDVWMNEMTTKEGLTPEGRDDADRQRVVSLRGK